MEELLIAFPEVTLKLVALNISFDYYDIHSDYKILLQHFVIAWI